MTSRVTPAVKRAARNAPKGDGPEMVPADAVEVTPRPKRPTTKAGREAAAAARRAAVADLSPAGQAAAIASGLADLLVDLLVDEPYPANPVEDDRPEDEVGGNHAPAGPVPSEAEMLAVESEPTDVVAETDRVKRLEAAKAEKLALDAWWLGGGKAPRPATPNLDAIAAEANHRPGSKPKPRKAASGTKAPRAPRAELPALYRQALDTHRAGKRGKGTKVSKDELTAHIVKVRAEHPELSMRQAQEVAYWVDGLAVSRNSWDPIWAALDEAG